MYTLRILKCRVGKLAKDFKNPDTDQMSAKESEEMQKERQELQVKLESQEKKVNYFERAKRLEEIPIMQANINEHQLKEKNFWEQRERKRIYVVTTRDRLSRMMLDKEEFLAKLKEERDVSFVDKLKEFEAVLAEEKKTRLLGRRINRKEERRHKYLKQKEETERKAEEQHRKAAEQRRKDEKEWQRLEKKARKEREKKERLERKEVEREKKEQKEMLDRAAALQRARAEELEKKITTRARLSCMKPDMEEFLAKLKKERNVVFEDNLKEFEVLLAAEKKKRLLERRAARKEERRAKYLKQNEKAERKAAEQRHNENENRQRFEEHARKECKEKEMIEWEEADRTDMAADIKQTSQDQEEQH